MPRTFWMGLRAPTKGNVLASRGSYQNTPADYNTSPLAVYLYATDTLLLTVED